LLRLDRDAETEQADIERKEKALADYQGQHNRPFEYEERLRELLVRQQEINSQLDLDKSDRQVVADMAQDEKAQGTFTERLRAEQGRQKLQAAIA
jgi:hypothetical protein